MPKTVKKFRLNSGEYDNGYRSKDSRHEVKQARRERALERAQAEADWEFGLR